MALESLGVALHTVFPPTASMQVWQFLVVGRCSWPKHGLVGQLKGTLRYERCQEHLPKRTVPLSKRDERDRRSGASETSVIVQVAYEGSSGRLRGCYGGRGECVDYLGLRRFGRETKHESDVTPLLEERAGAGIQVPGSS